MTWMSWRQSVSVAIDVTRRWVTFTDVHLDFVRAVQDRESLEALAISRPPR